MKPPDHRGDVGVAQLLEGLGGEGRAHAAGAVDDDGRVLSGIRPSIGELEVAPGHVDRAGHGPLLVLVGLAHVEQRVVIEARGDLVGVDLADFSLGGVQ